MWPSNKLNTLTPIYRLCNRRAYLQPFQDSYCTAQLRQTLLFLWYFPRLLPIQNYPTSNLLGDSYKCCEKLWACAQYSWNVYAPIPWAVASASKLLIFKRWALSYSSFYVGSYTCLPLTLMDRLHSQYSRMAMRTSPSKQTS